MPRLVWDQTNAPYESGLDRGVFFEYGEPGIPWVGLVSVSEEPGGGFTPRYVDGLQFYIPEEQDFRCTIDAFMYPPQLDSYILDVTVRDQSKLFGFSYRTKTDTGYKIHLIYNAQVSPSLFGYEQEEPSIFSWEVTTTPIEVPDAKQTSHLIIDTSVAYPNVVSELETMLYGSEESFSFLPTAAQVYNLFEENAILRVTRNGDGTFTVTGPDSAIQHLSGGIFEITWDSAKRIDENTYEISSL